MSIGLSISPSRPKHTVPFSNQQILTKCDMWSNTPTLIKKKCAQLKQRKVLHWDKETNIKINHLLKQIKNGDTKDQKFRIVCAAIFYAAEMTGIERMTGSMSMKKRGWDHYVEEYFNGRNLHEAEEARAIYNEISKQIAPAFQNNLENDSNNEIKIISEDKVTIFSNNEVKYFQKMK
jgi:hypothetical protein